MCDGALYEHACVLIACKRERRARKEPTKVGAIQFRMHSSSVVSFNLLFCVPYFMYRVSRVASFPCKHTDSFKSYGNSSLV